MPAPRLRAYPRETVIAEKFQAMVALGRANSRMKDLYDIWLLSRAYEFTGDGLVRAIAATFARRKTPVPAEPPFALTSAFAGDPPSSSNGMFVEKYRRRIAAARRNHRRPRRLPVAASRRGGNA